MEQRHTADEALLVHADLVNIESVAEGWTVMVEGEGGGRRGEGGGAEGKG